MVLMPRRLRIWFVLSIGVSALVAACPAAAQVINGESTYGDSDLHQSPADSAPPPDTAHRDERTQPSPTTERR